MFLGKCLREAGLKPSPSPKQWIPFKRYGFYKPDHWEEPRPHSIGVFYLFATRSEYGLSFPTDRYKRVVDFNVDRLVEEATELGFQLMGKNQEPRIDLRMHNDQAFFDGLFDLVVQTANELEGTLQQE